MTDFSKMGTVWWTRLDGTNAMRFWLYMHIQQRLVLPMLVSIPATIIRDLNHGKSNHDKVKRQKFWGVLGL